MDTSEQLQLRPDVVATVLENGAVLLDLATKYFYSVNASGWAILQMFENGAAPAQVITQCQAWGSDPADTQDIAAFLEALIRDNLVQKTEFPPSDQQISLETWTLPTIEKHKEPLQRIMTSAFDPTLPLAE